MGTKSAWTPERRAKQAEIIRATQPWTKSTGPRTTEGKEKSSQNARMDPVFKDAIEMRKAIMAETLEFFERKRRPRLRRPKRTLV